MNDDHRKILYQGLDIPDDRRRSSDHLMERIIGMLDDHQKRFTEHANSTTEYRNANDKRMDAVVAGQRAQGTKIDSMARCIEKFDRDWKEKYKPKLDNDLNSQKYWNDTKDENIKNVIKGTVWTAFLAVCYGLWLLLKESLKK